MSANVSDGEEKQLSPKQYTLIEALVSGHTIVASAKITGVSEKTAHLWLKQPAFKRAYQQAKQEIFDEKLEALKDDIHVAIDTLKRNMGESAKPYTQVIAASKFIDIALEIHKMTELEKKVLELEEMLRAR